MKSDVVVAEIRRLMQQHGGVLPPSAVVDAARPDESILHPLFDWDDTEAAEKWRIHQARQLIRVSVTYEHGRDGRDIPVRVFVSLTSERKADAGYRLMTDVLSDGELRAQLLIDAREDMKRFRTKYARLEELAQVFAAMEHV